MLFSDLTLSRRLERAEGHGCVQFAAARRKLFPESGSCWMKCAGADVVFDGVDSPVTQTFGLGLFESLTGAALDEIERFFLDRGAPVHHEVSPLAGVPAFDLLASRGYRPCELSSMMYRPVEVPSSEAPAEISVRLIGSDEAQLWADISAQGWTHERPELTDFMRQFGALLAVREDSPCFLAEIDGQPAAAGALLIHGGVALFAGAATIPQFRRRGLQAALVQARMRCAFDHGCDLAVMAAEAGGESQRNAERKGFHIAYTRTKWRL
jgi:GNAT superfamily N-acetyltransferase